MFLLAFQSEKHILSKEGKLSLISLLIAYVMINEILYVRFPAEEGFICLTLSIFLFMRTRCTVHMEFLNVYTFGVCFSTLRGKGPTDCSSDNYIK